MMLVAETAVREEASGPMVVSGVVDCDATTAATAAVQVSAVATDDFHRSFAVEMVHLAVN